MTEQSFLDWAAIRAAYLAGDATLDEIAAQFGVSRSGIQARARRHDWPKRKSRRGTPGSIRAQAPSQSVSKQKRANSSTRVRRKSAPVAQLGPSANDTSATPPEDAERMGRRGRSHGCFPTDVKAHDQNSRQDRALQARMVEVIEMQLDRLERRIAKQDELSSADCEREARALNGLIKNFETLAAMRTKATEPVLGAAKAKQSNGKEPYDQDAFRKDVASRIVKLREQLQRQSG